MSDAIVTSLIVAGAAIGGAAAPGVIGLITNHFAHAQALKLEELRHKQTIEMQGLQEQANRRKEQFARLRPIFEKLMNGARVVESIVLDMARISPKAEGFQNSLGSQLFTLNSARQDIATQLRAMDVEPGTSEVVDRYHDFADTVDLFIAGLVAQSDNPDFVFTNRSELINGIRHQSSMLRDAVQTHLEQLQ